MLNTYFLWTGSGYIMKELWNLYLSFAKIGGLTFGGGLAMLPMLKREVVERHHWVTEEEILDIYAIGQCTPGIIAVNTATYVGYKERGILGGIVATMGMISPSILIICLIASVMQSFITNPIVMHALAGIRIVVCSLMINTVITMAKKGIVDRLGILLFIGAFILVVCSPIPTVVIIIIAACIGIIAKKLEDSTI